MRFCYSCMKQVERDKNGRCPYCGEPLALPEPEESCLRPGTVLQDKYLVGKRIGSGGFGNTYIGINRFLQTKVAIKEYFPGHMSVRREDGTTVSVTDAVSADRFRQGLNRFLQEARAIAGLNDVRGVVEVQNFFEENSTGYIVMEYLEGMDVKSILRQRGGRMNYEWCRTVILTILHTLREVHRRGVLHRDIAPDNVFVTKDGVIKLIDFGAAKLATEVAKPDAELVLKPGYAPIEQYSRGAAQGPCTDLYAVAAMFYKMLTGVKPEPAIDRIQEDHLQSPLELGVKLPEKANQAIMKCLSIQQGERFQLAQEFMDALDGGSFQPIYEPEWILPKVKERRMPTAVKVLLILAVLLSLGGGVAGTLYLTRPPEKVQNTFGADQVRSMPNLIGLAREEAEKQLREIGFTAVHVSYDFNPSVPLDEVTEQEIPAGSPYDAKAEFELRVSGGSQRFMMPDCTLMTYDEAEQWFTERNALFMLRQDYSEYESEGFLISQGPVTGSVIDITTAEYGCVVYSEGSIDDY